MANFDEKLAYGLFTAVLAIPFLIASLSKRPWVRAIGRLLTAATALWIAAILFL